jgi:hypothetical protein
MEGSRHLPIRHLAGRATASAPAKHYPKQIQAVYDAITKDWWHYNLDPVGAEVLTVQPERVFDVTLGSGRKNKSGYGDCDDIAIASGALLGSIGFETIIATSVRPGSPHIFDHVFVFVKAPGMSNWMPFDPVLPSWDNTKGCGDLVAFKRMALWDLNGKLLKKIGPFPPRFDAVMQSFGRVQPKIAPEYLTGTEGKKTMHPNYYDFPDYTDYVQGVGLGEVPTNPRTNQPIINANTLPDFEMYGIAGFGCYNGEMGYTTGDQMPHIMAEVDNTDLIGNTGLVRTKHFEMDPDDYAYMIKTGVPRLGAMALADDGDIYTWQPGYDGLGGLFKRLARRVKKAVKRVGKRIKKGVRRVGGGIKSFAKRIGKTRVFRLGKRILKTAMKHVKPFLKKYGGKILTAVAPIAAMIPGAGPFISTALVVGGRAIDIAKKAKVVLDKVGRPIFKSVKQAKDFKSLLKNAAREMGKSGAKKVLAKLDKAKGLAGPGGCPIWKQGIQWRCVNAPGFGWA